MENPQFQLRNSHFVLGAGTDNPASIYTKDYTKKRADQDKSGQGTNPFRTSSLAKNFKMGQDQYLTTNMIKYPQWKNCERARLQEEKSKDLKTHHFNLGNYSQQSQTTNKFYHNNKPLPENSQGFAAQKNKMRSHNHDFREGPVGPLASVYNQEYSKKQQVEVPVAVKNNEIRQTHIVLGKEKTPMMTTNNIEYSKKDYVPVDKAKIPTSKFSLGTNQTDFKTTNQIYHQPQAYQASALPAQTMKQLRSTHFALGGSRPNYSTQASQYQAYPVAKAKAFQPQLQRTSKSIAPDSRFYGQTTNQRQLPKREMQTKENFKRSDFGSGWKLGTNEATSYRTESNTNYVPKTGQRCEVPIKPSGESLIIGGDTTDYTTTHRANYTKKQLPDRSDGQDDSSLRTNHFGHGQQDGNKYITVYQDEYREDQNNKSKLFHR